VTQLGKACIRISRWDHSCKRELSQRVPWTYWDRLSDFRIPAKSLLKVFWDDEKLELFVPQALPREIMPDMVYLDLRKSLMLTRVCVLGERANSGSRNLSRHDVDVDTVLSSQSSL